MKNKMTGIIMTVGAGALLAACTLGDSNPGVRSGYSWATPETQAMQDDDFSNPGYPVVDAAEEAWGTVNGTAGKSCASCHNDAADSMKTVGNTYPIYDEVTKNPINIELRINRCLTDNMGAKAYKYESQEMLGMTAFVRTQSKGMPVVSTAGDEDDALNPFWKQGKDFFYERRGQLDMACKHCHEDNAGGVIRADTLSQGQSNGFPTYRMKWNGLGSLHRRFRGCNKNIRAQPYGYGSDEYLALETYVTWRGRSLPVEAPAVRK